MRIGDMRLFLLIYSVLLLVNGFIFFVGDRPINEPSVIRFVISALFIFFMPGLVWGEILGFRSRHILSTAALSFAITFAIETFFLFIALLIGATISVWIILLLILSLSGVVLLLMKKGYQPKFVKPLWGFYSDEVPYRISVPLITTLILLISTVLYMWSENIFAIDGEKLLHLTYIRYYYTMELNISDLGIYKGMPPLNIIHLWEFLIAGWARISNVDPLIIFSHARAVVPFIGFASLYLLVSNIFTDRLKAEFIIWSVLIMCLGWFSLLSPSGLDWVKEDPLRGMMSFMSTAHHADSAMEILLPMLSAIGLITLRSPLVRNYILLGFVLIGAFMWHTREFFQTAIYFAIVILTILLIPKINIKITYKRILIIAGIFLIVAIGFYILMVTIAAGQRHGYDEFKLKEIAMAYGLQSMFDVRSPFHFPNDIRLTLGLNKDVILPYQQIADYVARSWNFYLWLVLSAFSTVILVFWGRQEDRSFVVFYLLLWFLTLCWGFSQFMWIVFTYSEINFTLPRFIYLFSYISIGAGLYVLFQRLQDRCSDIKGMLIVYGGFLICGLFFMLWWRFETPLASVLSNLFSVVFTVLFIAIYYPKLPKGGYLKKKEFFPGLLAVFIFFAPILAQDYVKFLSKAISDTNKSINWFGKDNPFGFSLGLIESIKKIEPKKTVLVNPFGSNLISLYAPLYYPIVPEIMGKTLVTATETYGKIRQEGHPLFRMKSTIPVDLKEEQITIKPDFKRDFVDIKQGVSIVNDIVKIAGPMVLHARQGDFIFEKRDNAIRVSPQKGKVNETLFISFGYALGDQGFTLNLRPNDDLLFMVSARVSGGGKAVAFLLDVADGKQEENNVEISGAAMKNYSVLKKLRSGVQAVSMGIHWQPKGEGDFIEFTNLKVYRSEDIVSQIRGSVTLVDHKLVKEWLTSNKVDFILVNHRDYDKLSGYFAKNISEYDIFYHNQDTKELLLRVKR